MAAIFITGTDTDVGKTYVGCAIAQAVCKNYLVRALKPVETGCKQMGNILCPADATALQVACGGTQSIESICQYRFNDPIAPLAASLQENRPIHIQQILEQASLLQQQCDLLIVEGAGGLYVPITKDCTMIDLAKKLHYPVLVVGRAGLGTINHTTLTLLALSKKSIPILGFVLSQGKAPVARSFAQQNAEAIEDLSGESCLGILENNAPCPQDLLSALCLKQP